MQPKLNGRFKTAAKNVVSIEPETASLRASCEAYAEPSPEPKLFLFGIELMHVESERQNLVRLGSGEGEAYASGAQAREVGISE